jgi:hypothetical protein
VLLLPLTLLQSYVGLVVGWSSCEVDRGWSEPVASSPLLPSAPLSSPSSIHSYHSHSPSLLLCSLPALSLSLALAWDWDVPRLRWGGHSVTIGGVGAGMDVTERYWFVDSLALRMIGHEYVHVVITSTSEAHCCLLRSCSSRVRPNGAGWLSSRSGVLLLAAWRSCVPRAAFTPFLDWPPLPTPPPPRSLPPPPWRCRYALGGRVSETRARDT